MNVKKPYASSFLEGKIEEGKGSTLFIIRFIPKANLKSRQGLMSDKFQNGLAGITLIKGKNLLAIKKFIQRFWSRSMLDYPCWINCTPICLTLATWFDLELCYTQHCMIVNGFWIDISDKWRLAPVNVIFLCDKTHGSPWVYLVSKNKNLSHAGLIWKWSFQANGTL